MPAQITDVRTDPRELHRSLSFASMEEASLEGVTYSRWLEQQDPSDHHDDGLDAFQRQLAVAGIRTSNDDENGIYADRFEVFEKDGKKGPSMTLGIEYLNRQWRKASRQNSRAALARGILSSDMDIAGSAWKPFVEAAQLRAEQVAPAIPLDELIAITTSIDNNVYRSLYMNEPPADQPRMVRVGEEGELPAAKISFGSRPIDLFKYGRRLDSSYENLRRAPIPLVSFYISRLAVQTEVDKVVQAMGVLINGDGNPNTGAENYNLTNLDPVAAAGTLSLLGWLSFKLKFKNPYALTTELVRESVLMQQLLLDTGSSNTLAGELDGFGFGGFEPINRDLSQNVRYGILDDAPAGVIVAFDKRFALERVTEIGADISEAGKWIEKQVNFLTFSEVEGYGKIDVKAAKTLTITA